MIFSFSFFFLWFIPSSSIRPVKLKIKDDLGRFVLKPISFPLTILQEQTCVTSERQLIVLIFGIRWCHSLITSYSMILNTKFRGEYQAISHWPWGAHLTIHSLLTRIVSFLESVIEFYKKGSPTVDSGKIIVILQYVLKVRRLVTLLLYLAGDCFQKEYFPMLLFFFT